MDSLMISPLELPSSFGGFSNYGRAITVISLLENGDVLEPQTVSLWLGMRSWKSDNLYTYKFVSMRFNYRFATSGSHSNEPSNIYVQCSPVNCCWSSPAKSLLVLGPIGTHDLMFVARPFTYSALSCCINTCCILGHERASSLLYQYYRELAEV
jgi:hypothetical protein